jgi:hypothetical protein
VIRAVGIALALVSPVLVAALLLGAAAFLPAGSQLRPDDCRFDWPVTLTPDGTTTLGGYYLRSTWWPRRRDGTCHAEDSSELMATLSYLYRRFNGGYL